MTVDQVIDMIAMRHRFMPATRPVPMLLPMTCVGGAAFVRVARRDTNHVTALAPGFHVIQMAVLQIIYMTVVSDGGMTASCAVPLGGLGRCHGWLLVIKERFT